MKTQSGAQMTLFESEIIYVLIRGTALLSLVALFYGFVSDIAPSVLPRGFTIGLAFGFAAVIAMSDPFELGPGVIVDARGIVLVLAAPFGGPLAGLISGLIAGAYRLWIGGAGAYLGVIVVVSAVLIGILCSRFVRKREGGYDPSKLLVLATLGCAQSFLLLLIPFFAPGVDPMRTLVPHVAANWFGILLLGHFLTGVGRRRHATRILQREAFTDSLTGLPNRRAFDQSVERLSDLRERGEVPGPVALLLIDIDHFKQVNDQWGHFFGDKVLRSVSTTIRRQVRRGDILARYGGEEIAVILPSTQHSDACSVAERIRMAVENGEFRVKITASVGVAIDEDINAFCDLFQAADRALYRAKKNGRNRIELEILPELVGSDEALPSAVVRKGRTALPKRVFEVAWINAAASAFSIRIGQWGRSRYRKPHRTLTAPDEFARFLGQGE
ncbi:periplasmic sensor diguanylate cyclase (GGDEF) [Fulvimarina pelagi HTCC2506]|uniref:diguanylate cyclase n=1 Tax=Fulvimarina pelagi HTCC2506 TaxID=314231 RepID=Q0G1R3_9HYPH|nr:periplasmic sensor diguanylate cyclase (GGDEF) [Fulvimarina pelagi HTCC2506]